MSDDDFFPPIPPPPRHTPAPQPEWFGPSTAVLGRAVAIDPFVLGRTGEVALVVEALRAYPNGVAFTLVAVGRAGHELRDLLGPHHGPPGVDPDDHLRFGVELSDGRRAIEMPAWAQTGSATPAGPVLRRGRGGGGGARYDLEYWLWPLPPRGPLTFACRWRGRGLAMSRHTISADPIVDAAAGARDVWED